MILMATNVVSGPKPAIYGTMWWVLWDVKALQKRKMWKMSLHISSIPIRPMGFLKSELTMVMKYTMPVECFYIRAQKPVSE